MTNSTISQFHNCRIVVWLEWPEACFCATADDIEYLKSLTDGEVVWVRRREDFIDRLPTATHVITWHFETGWYALAPNLRLVATPAAGRELIAWRDAPEGVAVHFGTFHGDIIAESVVAFCMAWARGFFRTPPPTGIWPREWLGDKCYTISGTKAVIAGYGKIGKAIGAKFAALGASVKGFGRKNISEMSAAMAEADWFIMALPSDTGTDNFLDANRIAMLSPRCVVVNIGRGNAIDEDALRQALVEGRIAAAYLDVFKNEPTCLNVDQSQRAKAGGLWDSGTPNLVPMPHSSAFSPDYMKRCFAELAALDPATGFCYNYAPNRQTSDIR